MRGLLVALLALASTTLSAQEAARPFAPDAQEKFRKLLVEFQQRQSDAAQLQRQFDQTMAEIRRLQSAFEAECAAAAKAENVDLARFNCDLKTLSFMPKQPSGVAPAEAK